MTCRDRTQEFMATCKSMQSRQQNGIQPIPTGATRQRTEFTLIAKHFWILVFCSCRRIGKDLSSTFTKLEKLTLLAKRKSLFDDKAADIEELTYIIKKDINSLHKQIAQLQEFVRGRGTQSSRHMQTHSNTVVISLQSRLASMSNTFKNVLEVRTENLKEQRSRREHFTQSTVSSLPPPIMNGHAVSLLLQDDEPRAAQGDGTVVVSMEPHQQQLQLIDEQDTYIQSRADAVQNIESTIVELGSIFQQLVHMVKEQEEQILRIDSNVDDTQLNVEAVHSELLRYFQSVTNNRWLIVKVFLVLILFFVIFVVFLA
uniref:syntaxin-5 isoform X2 n=1 Tax=Myxine glutinosa TaxID=7769 RepID=UPI00358F3552